MTWLARMAQVTDNDDKEMWVPGGWALPADSRRSVSSDVATSTNSIVSPLARRTLYSLCLLGLDPAALAHYMILRTPTRTA
mgnify:CR=1 FL=1